MLQKGLREERPSEGAQRVPALPRTDPRRLHQATRGAKASSRGPKRPTQTAPRGPKTTRREPKAAQDRAQGGPRGSKMTPRRPQEASSGPEAPHIAKFCKSLTRSLRCWPFVGLPTVRLNLSGGVAQPAARHHVLRVALLEWGCLANTPCGQRSRKPCSSAQSFLYAALIQWGWETRPSLGEERPA